MRFPVVLSVVQSSAPSLQAPTSLGAPHNPNKTLALETQRRQAKPSHSRDPTYSARLVRTPNSPSKTRSNHSRLTSSVNRNNRNSRRTCSANHSSKLSSNPNSRVVTCSAVRCLGATPSNHNNRSSSNNNLSKALSVGSARSVHQTNSSNSRSNNSLIFSGQQIQVMPLGDNPRRSKASETLVPQVALGSEEEAVCSGRNRRRRNSHNNSKSVFHFFAKKDERVLQDLPHLARTQALVGSPRTR